MSQIQDEAPQWPSTEQEVVTQAVEYKKPLPLHKIHTRTICAARKGRTQKEVQEIINLEIEWYLRENPGYFFEKHSDAGPVKNADQSVTYTMHFKRNL